MASPAQSSAPLDPLLGRVLAGTYRLEGVLGRGAMGTVYRAEHLLLGEAYAVKVLHPDLAGDEDVRRRFLQEARALTRFTHRNAVAVRHCGEELGLVFLAMDLCPGETLEALLAREGSLPETRALALASQVLEALAEAQRVGIIHRDLKPANVMVVPAREGEPEEARVLDFGLSRLLREQREGAQVRISSVGEVVGTVAYMSPEQALGEELDGRSDLFSLGVVLHEMVEGRHPFAGGGGAPGSMASVITRLLDVDRVLAGPGTQRRASPALARVLRRALLRDREQRYPDARALLAALQDVRAGRAPAAAPPAPPEPAPASRRSVRARRAALVALVLALAGGALVQFVVRRTSTPDAAAVDLRTLARREVALGQDERALPLYERLVAEGLATAEDRLAMAELRTRLLDPSAEADLVAAERLLPGDARVAVARGRLRHKIGRDPIRAREAFAQALTLDQGHGAARLARLELLLDDTLESSFVEQREDRLTLALGDVESLEKCGCAPAEVALMSSRLFEAQGLRPGADAAACFERALGQARRAAHGEPLWGLPLEQVARVLQRQAARHRASGAARESEALLREAVDALEEARARVAAAPDHRRQGGEALRLLRLTLNARAGTVDRRGLAEAARTLGQMAAGEAGVLKDVAAALRTAGAHEEAIPLYRILRDIAPDGPVLSDLAFCQQRLGLLRLLAGERAEGLAALEAALEAYDEALRLTPRAPVPIAYRAETLTLLARWDPSRASAFLERAAADFDAVETLSVGEGEFGEVRFRRSALRLALGDVDGATQDMAEIVGGRPALNAALHYRYGRCLLMQAVRDAALPAPPVPDPRWDQAAEQLERAAERSGEFPGPSRLLRAQLEALRGDGAAAEVHVAQALEPGVMPSEDLRAEAQLWDWLVRRHRHPSEPAAGAADALRRRARELAAGREAPSPEFYGDLVRALAESTEGAPGLAEAARRLSARTPP